MYKVKFAIVLLFTTLLSCNINDKKNNAKSNYPNVVIVSAMKNVMWKGEMHGKIKLDTIKNKSGLYGLGPEAYLTGEILINNGKTFLSKVASDSTIIVKSDDNVEAPFFVYGNVNNWNEIKLPETIKSIEDLEDFIDKETKNNKRPFAFKLNGSVLKAAIHIQNLPKGTKVSSPKEAHQGQVNYNLENENVEIIGFFSTTHQGIFTHHDSFLHMHLITQDEKKMGHLDKVTFNKMTLFLPKS